ncbi:MAG: hypothetical protein Q7R96_04665 [Nanoarchaeota archaeon]|nr:hypothetical protein [Nanoarchaeota archaeon]
MMNGDEAKVQGTVGRLVVDILKKVFQHRSDVDSLMSAPSMVELREGRFSKSLLTQVATVVRAHEPVSYAAQLLEDRVTPAVYADLKPLLDKGDVVGVVTYLLEQSSVVVNPYAAPVKEVAKSLVGAPIVYLPSLSRSTAGVIKEVGVYENDDDPLGDLAPGTLGIWRGRRGSVACIAAHDAGKHGYLALFSVVAGDVQGMKDIVAQFGFEDNVGKSVLSADANLRIMLNDDKPLGGLRVVSKDKKGSGCSVVYCLGQ